MTYGMQIRLSSGLTSVDDVYTIRPKEEHEIDKGTAELTLTPTQDINYGSFTTLGIDYDSSTDAYFTKRFSMSMPPNTTKINHWASFFWVVLVDADLPHTLTLDDVNETVSCYFQDSYWISVTATGTVNTKAFLDFTIIKIKAS